MLKSLGLERFQVDQMNPSDLETHRARAARRRFQPNTDPIHPADAPPARPGGRSLPGYSPGSVREISMSGARVFPSMRSGGAAGTTAVTISSL
jgi:hypothetical protein